MHVDWGGIARDVAFTVLGLYVVYAPFAYKFARNEGNTRFAATTRTILLFILMSLWIAGGGSVVYGIGMVFDRPDESCGLGCVVSGEGHWQAPKGTFILLGALLILAAWFLEKFVQWFITLDSMRTPESKGSVTFDIERVKRINRSIEDSREAWRKGEPPVEPIVIPEDDKTNG